MRSDSMQNKIIGVVAPKGSGKTTTVAGLVAITPRVAIYDPMAATDTQYRRVASHIVVNDLSAAHKVMAENNFQLLYEPALPRQDGAEWVYPDFIEFLRRVWRRVQLVGPMMLVIDEAHYTMSARTMPLEMWNIITNGRRYGLDIVWVTQRFVGVNGWVRANADEYWFARLVHPADLQTVASVCGSDVAEQVRALRRLDANRSPVVPGEILVWNSLDGSAKVIDLRRPESLYQELSAAQTNRADSNADAECPSDSDESLQEKRDSASDASVINPSNGNDASDASRIQTEKDGRP